MFSLLGIVTCMDYVYQCVTLITELTGVIKLHVEYSRFNTLPKVNGTCAIDDILILLVDQLLCDPAGLYAKIS